MELWTEINERSALRAKAEAHPSLPTTSHAHKGDEVQGTLFDELVGQYSAIATRAEDMMVRHISSEVEVELKSYFARCVVLTKDLRVMLILYQAMGKV